MAERKEVPPQDPILFSIRNLERRVQTISIMVTILSLFVAALALSYQVWSNETGPLWGRIDPRVSVGRQLTIQNGLWGWTLECNVELVNLGTRSFDVGKMDMYVALEKGPPEQRKTLAATRGRAWYSSEYVPLAYFTARPRGGGWNGRVAFEESWNRARTEKVGDLNCQMFRELQDKYFSDSNKASNATRLTYDISDELFERLRAAVAENVSWMQPGRYRLLISIPYADNRRGFVYRGGFSFELTKSNIELLSNLQGRAYKFPSEAVGNWHMIFLVRVPVEPLNTEETELLAREADKAKEAAAATGGG